MKFDEKIIGTRIIYEDYLCEKRSGFIAYVEEYAGEDAVDENGQVKAWIYIADDDEDKNINRIMVNGDTIYYCDLRLSTEIFLDE